MPLVSVIVPAHNAEKHLSDTVASVLAQTYKNFELIIVNDASLDGTGTLANELAKTDKCIRVIHHTENKLRSGALNTGIIAAKGSYISILDADDLYRPDKLEKQVAYLEKRSDIDMVYGDFEMWKEGVEKKALVSAAASTKECHVRLTEAVGKEKGVIFEKGFIPSCSPLLRRSVFETIHFDESMRNMEDLDLWLQFFGANFTAIRLPFVTYTYRLHENQKSRDTERRQEAKTRIQEKIRGGAYVVAKS